MFRDEAIGYEKLTPLSPRMLTAYMLSMIEILEE
jgi:hypothetical protein